ncbi:MAG: adenylate/guanylate cyclase domain-containing protein [bacterium]|nr:adenylate/guanylate cyclase domain-containing protein [bacterium]
MSTSRNQVFVATVALLAATLVVGNLAIYLLPDYYSRVREGVTDRLFRHRSDSERYRPVYDGDVVQVVVDDTGIRLLGRTYLDRIDHAQLVANLAQAGVTAQFHDVIVAEPVGPAQDQPLLEAVTEAGNVFFGLSVGLTGGTTRDEPRIADKDRPVLDGALWRVDGPPEHFPRLSQSSTTFVELAAAARGNGFLDLTPDAWDGIQRRLTLLVRYEDGLVPALALRVACDYLSVDPSTIRIEPGRIVLPEARRPQDEKPRDIEIPIDGAGSMRVDYLGKWGAMTQVPFLEVFEASDDRFIMKDLRDQVDGKIAVLYWATTGSGDAGPVPTDETYIFGALHANAIQQIVSGRFLWAWSPLRMILLVQLPLFALLLLASTRLSATPFVGTVAASLVAYGGLAAWLFLAQGWILDIPGPIVLVGTATLLVSAYRFHVESMHRAVLRSTFDAYFPPAVVDKAVAQSDHLAESAQKKELTILFSDIKSFTSHTSEMEAGHVRKLLNEYFERMIEIVFRHGGTLDKFIGDGLMVFFGDPEDQPDHAARCIRAGIEMQHAARELDAEWRRRGDMPLIIRVGINSGEVVVGNMGSERRLSYTVLGEPVNLAQRLESNAPSGGILISARTHELARGAVRAIKLEPIRVKGIDRPIEVYEVPVESDSAAPSVAADAGSR